jgi:hypothetical protein
VQVVYFVSTVKIGCGYGPGKNDIPGKDNFYPVRIKIRLMSVLSDGLVQVSDQIVHIFNAYAQADE